MLKSQIKVALFFCIATNLTHFLPSIASNLKNKSVTLGFFSKNLFVTHRRDRKNYKKFCAVDFRWKFPRWSNSTPQLFFNDF